LAELAACYNRGLHQFLRALGNAGLRRAVALYLVFNLGYLATWVAILVWAYNEGGAARAGVVAVVQIIPSMLIAPFASHAGDRYPRERALAGGFLVQGLTMGLTAGALLGDAHGGLILAAATLSSMAFTSARPMLFALLPDLAYTPEEVTVANSLSSSWWWACSRC